MTGEGNNDCATSLTQWNYQESSSQYIRRIEGDIEWVGELVIEVSTVVKVIQRQPNS